MDADTVYNLLKSSETSALTKMIILLRPYLELKSKNKTLLQMAFSNAEYELAAYLIKGGVNIYIRDRDGNTPLIIAAREIQLELTELLINRGADIYDQTMKMFRPTII